MPTPDSTLPQVIDSCHEFLKWLISILGKFPLARRFTLGKCLKSSVLAVLK